MKILNPIRLQVEIVNAIVKKEISLVKEYLETKDFSIVANNSLLYGFYGDESLDPTAKLSSIYKEYIEFCTFIQEFMQGKFPLNSAYKNKLTMLVNRFMFMRVYSAGLSRSCCSATFIKVLPNHLVDGYTIFKIILNNNYNQSLKEVFNIETHHYGSLNNDTHTTVHTIMTLLNVHGASANKFLMDDWEGLDEKAKKFNDTYLEWIKPFSKTLYAVPSYLPNSVMENALKDKEAFIALKKENEFTDDMCKALSVTEYQVSDILYYHCKQAKFQNGKFPFVNHNNILSSVTFNIIEDDYGKDKELNHFFSSYLFEKPNKSMWKMISLGRDTESMQYTIERRMQELEEMLSDVNELQTEIHTLQDEISLIKALSE